MNPEIKVLGASNEWVIEQICQLLRQQYNPQISACFIYQDANYKNYLKKLLHSEKDKFFYCIDPDSGYFFGFSHFKIDNHSIFLNNIIIDETYKGIGIGKILLREGIVQLLDTHTADNFELDVFKKNERALNWYLKLGMEVSGYKNWYDITTYIIQNGASIHDGKNFKITSDKNGFNQLFFTTKQIGTLINNTHLIIRTEPDDLLLNNITYFFKSSNLQSVCLISQKELQFPLIDQSLRLTIPLEELEIIKFSA